jgi:hypothetical protein
MRWQRTTPHDHRKRWSEDIVGELISQTHKGVTFMLRVCSNLEFANNIIVWLYPARRRDEEKGGKAGTRTGFRTKR